MKLTVEINEKQFLYSYEIGESKHNGSSYLTADNLVLFCDLVRICSSVYKYADKEWERKQNAKALWLLEKQKKRNLK